MKKIPFLAISAVFVFSLCFTSCDEFFSSSWGSNRKYDASKINLNLGNLDQWVEAAVGNPDLADALTEAIKGKAKNSSGKDRARYQEAGIKVAVESTGVGTSILTNAIDALADVVSNGDEPDEGTLKDILDAIQDDFISAGGPQAAEDILEFLEDDIIITNPGNVPMLTGDYADIAKPGDIAQALIVLILGELGDRNIYDLNLDDIQDLVAGLDIQQSPPRIVIAPPPQPSETALVLAAYLNLIASDPRFDGSIITDLIREAFGLN